ncbi:hypothetical protein DRQ25_11655 [Candidatus Fermentibacteria bacterium]|nr:MAG: hypothetical protein DRQ25_11655 [Candidatus Fermentibacteria bacterium]
MGSLDNFVNGPRPAEKKYISSDVQAFSYYSGSQISIWFGDIWVEDVTQISFQYNQEKRPIYGYASQYFDAVAKGQVLIQGNFVVNFREKGYLSYIIANLPKLEQSLDTTQSGQDYNEKLKVVRGMVTTHLRNGTFGPGTFTEIEELAKKDNFWEQAELYENVIWGDGLEDKETPKYIATPDVLQHDDFPRGFNILITYGNLGAKETYTLQDMTTSTTKALNGVHLLGSSQVIRATGEPVQEAYSFMAKGMDNYVGTSF